MAAKRELIQGYSPKGRVINASLFEKDVYTDPKGREGKPSYKIEMAFDPADVTGEGTPENPTLEDLVIKAATKEWGNTQQVIDDVLNDVIENPLIDGNKLKAKREAKGKPGDAYGDKIVVRASTVYNADGADAPGGIYVCDEEAKRVEPANRGAIYNGCYGIAHLTFSAWSIDERRGVTVYLGGFQKVADGERLASVDKSTLFKPVGRPAGAAPAGRRTARG